jgi:DNA-binding LacI/PurR family transcriptional regulator
MLWKIVLKQPKSLLIDTFYLSDYQHIRKKFPGVPVCLVHNELPSQEIDCSGVFVDYAALFDKAFEYLLNKGHRKILTIGFFPDLNPNDSRFRIIAESVQRNGGILGSKEFPYLCYLDFLKNPAKLNEVFKNKDDYPTAFVGMNDHIIYQSIITFKERFPHLSVPEAIGIYDTSWSQMPGNEFHSFNLNFQELWKKAIAVLNNEYSGGKSFHWISPTCIERIQTERSCN